MNAADRKAVSDEVSKLEEMKSDISMIGEALRELADAEQEKYDNLSEGLQASEKGQAIQTAAEALDEAASECDEGNIQSALDALGNIE